MMRHGPVLPVIELTSCYGKHWSLFMEDLMKLSFFIAGFSWAEIRYDKMTECLVL